MGGASVGGVNVGGANVSVGCTSVHGAIVGIFVSGAGDDAGIGFACAVSFDGTYKDVLAKDL